MSDEFTEENDAMPHSWELKHSQGHQKSVTATIAFDGVVGPMAQAEALDKLVSAATCFGAPVRNLQRERARSVS